MKKQSNLSRLMGYAGGHKILTYLSWVLSVMSALLALVPFGIYGVLFTTYWRFPGLLTGGECHRLRLVCRIVCSYLYCCLHSRFDVFAFERVPGCR